MIKNSTLFVMTAIVLSPIAWSCTPEVKKSNPPRLINGKWVKEVSPNTAELTRADLTKLKNKNFDFIFSGIYTKEVSFSKKKLSYIETRKIWQGNVPDIVDVNMSKPPTDTECNKLKYDQEYLFFAKFGSRNNPIILKEFRKPTTELKTLLGKPEKQWLRGRLIKSK